MLYCRMEFVKLYKKSYLGMSVTMVIQPLLLGLVFSVTSAQLQWKFQIVDNGTTPEPRRDAAVGYDTFGQQLVLFGGRSAATFGDTWIYNITSHSWREVLTQSGPSPRFSMVYGTSGNYFYVATGEESGLKRIYYNDIWRFSFRSENWEKLPAQSRPQHISSSDWNKSLDLQLEPRSRFGATGGIYPGSSKFYVNQGFSDQHYFDTFTYDVTSQGWNLKYCPLGECTPYDPRYPHARSFHAGTMVDSDILLIFGGCLTGGGSGGPCPSGDSWIFDGKTLEWVRIQGCPVPRTYGSMAVLPVVSEKKRVVMYGGMEDGPQVIRTSTSFKDTVSIFDVVTQTWRVLKTDSDNGLYPSKRASVSMVSGDDGIFVFGGLEVDSGEVMSDLWLLAGDSDSVDKSPHFQCPQHFINMATLHGIFMVVGWAFFLQWGLFLARYFRSSGSRMWFFVHIIFQIFGLLCCIAGLVFAILSVQFDHLQSAHGIIGVVALVGGVLQPLNAALRPHRPDLGQESSRRRKLWEWLHHTAGQVSVMLAFINISLGLFMVVSIQIVWAVWFSYFGFVLLVYFVAETIVFCRGNPTKQMFFPNRNLSIGLAGNKKFISAYSNPAIEQDSERL